jgi:hypothetical protein
VTTWQPLAIGAGGYLTGLDVAPDGTRVVRTDTFGAYRWNAGTSRWVQLVTALTMPAGDNGHAANGDWQAEGVYEIAIAPSNASRFYMTYRGYVFRSDDAGAHWTRTAFVRSLGMDPNDQGTYLPRTMGRRIAVDPANPDIVYIGTVQDGLWRTTNGGSSWSKITAVPTATLATGGMLVAFDGSTKIYCASFGQGLWLSSNSGSTWGAVAGAPVSIRHLVVRNGVVWTTGIEGSQQGLLKKYTGSWATMAVDPGQPDRVHTLDVDPANANRIVAVGDGGFLSVTTNGGSSWTGWAFGNPQSGSDIPWHDWANDVYMSAGDARFDPLKPGILGHAWGVGYHETTPPNTQVAAQWKGYSKGIEQLVANQILSPPGAAAVPLVVAWDRPIFRVEDPLIYPSQYGPNRDNQVMLGSSADWASGDPGTIVLLCQVGNAEESSVSHDGGLTWAPMPTVPLNSRANFPGGMIAAASATNWVWIGAQDSKAVYYTLNGGTTWLVGLTVTGDGISHSCFIDRQILCADRVNVGTFYFYYNGSANSDGAGTGADGALAGIYRSTNGGQNWAKVHAGRLFGNSNSGYGFGFYKASLKAVPGQAGHLFLCSGGVDGSVVTELWRSIDGGVSWTAVPNVTEVIDVGFGATRAGQSYPSVYIAGYVGGISEANYGIWRSDDNCATWISLTVFPVDNIDPVKCISGDSNNWGRVYVGHNGSGWSYGFEPASNGGSSSLWPMSVPQFVTVDRAVLPADLLERAKDHMRVRHSEDDSYIRSCIARAIDYFERTMNVAVNPASISWAPASTDFADGVAYPPLRPISGMTAAATAGDVSAQYRYAATALFGMPAYLIQGDWQDGLVFTFASGFSATTLLPGIEECLFEYATHLYEHREIFVNSGTDVVPAWIMNSFATWWVPRV